MTERAPLPADAPPGPRPGEPRIIYLVKRIELIARSHLDRITREQGLTTLQYTALSVLRAQPGLSAAQLARRSFVTAQAMTEMVNILESKGMIRREPAPENRRVLRAHLTDGGRDALDACDTAADALEDHMLAELGEQGASDLRRALGTCAATLRTFDLDGR